MVRKQIYITAEQDARLKRLAEEQGETEAQVVRRALDRLEDVTYRPGEVGTGAGRVQEAATVMERYVAGSDSYGTFDGLRARTFEGRRLDATAWADEVDFITSLAKTTKGTTDRFDRDELYEERESKLLR